jgi:aspartate carbamoyltransferase catalytic subunit
MLDHVHQESHLVEIDLVKVKMHKRIQNERHTSEVSQNEEREEVHPKVLPKENLLNQ